MKTYHHIPMTKYIPLYTLLGLSVLLAACSDDLTPDVNTPDKGRIRFSASLPGISSRATEITNSTIGDIQVSSLLPGQDTPYFLDKIFTRNTITGKYASDDPQCIWPNSNDRLVFMASAPTCSEMREAGSFGEEGFVTAEDNSYGITDFMIASDIAAQTDFITAVATGNLLDNDEAGIDLDFRHQLSRIEVRAWGASKSYNLEIAGIRMAGVGTRANYIYDTSDVSTSTPGHWESVENGYVEYIYRAGDRTVLIDKDHAASAASAVSVMGKPITAADKTYGNSAMLIPSAYQAWDYTGNAANGDGNTDGMYFSVLMRVTDITPYASATEPLIYPYSDNDEGMEVVYLAVDKADHTTVLTRLYRQGDGYYTDPECTSVYDAEANAAEVKAYGWAAMPVADVWQPGLVYTYSLNYTGGVGLRDPRDPQPGKPIISDKVLINVNVSEWQAADDTGVTVPRK